MPQALTSGIVLQNNNTPDNTKFLHIDVGNVGTISRSLTLQVVNWGLPSFVSPTGPVGNFLAPVTDTYAPKTAKQFNVVIPFNTHYEIRLISADGSEITTGVVITSVVTETAGAGALEGYTQFVNDYKVVNI